MSEPVTIDNDGNVFINPPIVCTECGKPGNKYTALCDACEIGD
jgi:hypothetical protein